MNSVKLDSKFSIEREKKKGIDILFECRRSLSFTLIFIGITNNSENEDFIFSKFHMGLTVGFIP